jgi:hypothetical protein
MSELDNDVNTSIDSSTVDTGAEGTTNAASAVPVENRVAELNRKFSKFERTLDEKFSQLINYVQQGAKTAVPAPTQAVDKTPIESILNSNVETIVNQKIMQQKHAESYQDVLRSYPELNQEADTFDEKFHSKADAYYRALSSINDPEAPLKAVRLAAMDLGKYEQVERERLIADEARRMRTLGDGGSSHKGGQPSQNTDTSKLKGLAGLMGVDTKGLEQHMKKNANKYGYKG